MKEKRCFLNHLKVAVKSVPTKLDNLALSINQNETKYVSEAPLVTILSKIFSLNYEIVESADGNWGELLPDGNWTGMIGLIHRGEADIGIAELAINEQRAAAINFSYPFDVSAISFITDKPKYSSDVYAILHPFSNSVWTGIVISLIVLQIISHFFQITDYSFQTLFVKIYAILLERSVNIVYREFSTYMFMLSWICGTFFLTMAYKAVFFSFLTIPTLTGIKTIEQLAAASEQRSFKCSTWSGTRVNVQLLESGGHSWKKIADCIKRSQMFTNDIESFLESTTDGKAFIAGLSRLSLFKEDYFISDETFRLQTYGVAIRKKFPCEKELNRKLNRLVASGILQKTWEGSAFFKKLHKKGVENENFNRNRQLELKDLTLLFIVLLFGYFMAFIVFVLEVMADKKYFQKKYKIMLWNKNPKLKERKNSV